MSPGFDRGPRIGYEGYQIRISIPHSCSLLKLLRIETCICNNYHGLFVEVVAYRVIIRSFWHNCNNGSNYSTSDQKPFTARSISSTTSSTTSCDPKLLKNQVYTRKCDSEIDEILIESRVLVGCGDRHGVQLLELHSALFRGTGYSL